MFCYAIHNSVDSVNHRSMYGTVLESVWGTIVLTVRVMASESRRRVTELI